MAIKLSPGDIVRLNVPCISYEIIDEEKNKHQIAEQMSDQRVAREKIVPPWKLFNSVTGIYLGGVRLKLKDRRATRGVVRRYFHHFLFGTQEVMIEHQHVDVFISFNEIANISSQ